MKKMLLIPLLATLISGCVSYGENEKTEFNESVAKAEMEVFLREKYENDFATINWIGFQFEEEIDNDRKYYTIICHDINQANGWVNLPMEYVWTFYNTQTKNIFTKEMTESEKML